MSVINENNLELNYPGPILKEYNIFSIKQSVRIGNYEDNGYCIIFLLLVSKGIYGKSLINNIKYSNITLDEDYSLPDIYYV